MFEHPYFSHQIIRFEQEEMERRLACRLLLAEHADQIVVRPGVIARMLRRLVPARAGVAVETRSATGCEPAVAR